MKVPGAGALVEGVGDIGEVLMYPLGKPSDDEDD